MTDPIPEQIEAAAKAIYEHEKSAAIHHDLWPTWSELSSKADPLDADLRRDRAGAAINAAAGVTPQESGECGGDGECRAQPPEHGCFADAGDCEVPGGHAAPVQVDEAKLAAAIEQHVLGDPNGGTASVASVN